MNGRSLVLGCLVALALLAVVPLAPAAAQGGPAATGTTPLKGNLTGPSLLATNSNGTFYLNASGGAAVVAGLFAGDINWSAFVVGANTNGTSVKPSNGTITNTTKLPLSLAVTTGAIVETLTLEVKVTSQLLKTNSTTNLSKTFRLASPYTVRATLVAGPNAAILPFNVTVLLDGNVVGSVAVPKLAPDATYSLVYRYPTVGLSSGYHTFTLSVTDEHGLVTFANGTTVQSMTFYVAPSPPNNTLWYVVGVVAFFGVLFIYATRVAARRRGPGRR